MSCDTRVPLTQVTNEQVEKWEDMLFFLILHINGVFEPFLYPLRCPLVDHIQASFSVPLHTHDFLSAQCN